MSDAVWLAIIGVIAMCVKEYFDRMRARDAAAKTEANAAATAKNAEGIAEVKKATDGMKTELVAAVREASFMRGEKQGTEAGLQQGRDEAKTEAPHAPAATVPINVQAETMTVQAEAVSINPAAPKEKPK